MPHRRKGLRALSAWIESESALLFEKWSHFPENALVVTAPQGLMAQLRAPHFADPFYARYYRVDLALVVGFLIGVGLIG
jgi:hypothetical protein